MKPELTHQSQKKLIKIIASVIGIGVLIAIAFLIHYRNSHTPSPIVSTDNGSKSVTFTVPMDTPPSQPQTPQTLLDISGSGAQQTQPFTTAGNWTVAYTFDCTNFGYKGNFQFDVNNTDGSSNRDTGANDLAMTGGTTDYYYDAGEHYLTINSECAWHIVVKG